MANILLAILSFTIYVFMNLGNSPKIKEDVLEEKE